MKKIFVPLLSAAIVFGGLFIETSAFADDKKADKEKPAKKKSAFFPFRGMIKAVDAEKGTITLPGARGKGKDGKAKPDRVFALAKKVKLTLDGKVKLDIPGSVIPAKLKNGNRLRLTAMDVAPNGDLFVVDGYSSDRIHHFDKAGKYLKSFGGKKEFGTKTLHKICIDTRYSPPRILGADREGLRLIHVSLEGKFLGVYAKDVLRPAAVAVHGDLAVAGEIKGRATLYDKAGKVVAQLGHNITPGETATNRLPPAKWRPGIFSAPHGVAFNAAGDLFVAEYTVFGRIHRYNMKR